VRADPQIGRRLDSAQIDETPILGRKVTTLPLLNSAFRQAKGTGDLFRELDILVTGVVDDVRPRSPSTARTTMRLGAAKTAIATVPLGARPGNECALERVFLPNSAGLPDRP